MELNLLCFSSLLDFVTRILRMSTCLAGAGGRLGKEWNYTESGEWKGGPFLQCSVFRGLFSVFPCIQAEPWKDRPFSELASGDAF